MIKNIQFLFSRQGKKLQTKIYPIQYPKLQPNNLQPIIPRSRPIRRLTPKYQIPIDGFVSNHQIVNEKQHNRKWKSPSNSYALSIGFIGPVNAGKSQLMCKLSHHVSAISPKAVTTDEQIEAIKSFERDSEDGPKNIQLKYIDSPGLMYKRQGFVSRGFNVLGQIQLALVVVDSAKRCDDLVRQSIRRLEKHNNHEDFMKALVLNKVDLVNNRRKFASLISQIQKHSKFDKIFYVSAKTGYGVKQLEEYLIGKAMQGDMFYPPQSKTTSTQVQIYEELLKQCIFHRVYKQVPHQLVVKCVSCCEKTNGVTQLQFDVFVESQNQQRMLLGKKGRNMQWVLQRYKSQVYLEQQKIVNPYVTVKIRRKQHRKQPGYEETTLYVDENQESKQKIKLIEETLALRDQ